MRLAILPLLVCCSPPGAVMVSTPAPAEVDGDGYHDTADPSPVLGRVHVTMHEERYELRGRTAAELSQDLHRRRPRDERFTGWTRWRLRWRFEPTEGQLGCEVGPVDVDLELTTVLPRWETSQAADPRLVQAWSDYLEALEVHEQGHGDLAREAAERIRDRLTAIGPAVDCASLRDQAHRVGHAEVQRLRRDNAWLDESTGHGATQGAIFPGPDRLVAGE